jgi:tRNA(Ile)-lysidine synthetase-like protein
LYHDSVHFLAQRVFHHIRQKELLKAGDRVGVAVSGGIDSVAMLRLFLELRGELGIVLSVVHFNHKLRGAEADADEEFVAGLARAHDLEFYGDSDDVAGHAQEEGVSVETAARELRYGFFRHLLGEDRDTRGLKPGSSECASPGPEGPLFHRTGAPYLNTRASYTGASYLNTGAPYLNKVVTGHTLDDQAETVLMRMVRGAGLRGMGGIYPRIEVEDDQGDVCGEIVRPLLSVRRRELEQYLREIGQAWREDASNDDAKFTRNRVRKLVVPLLEREFNPAVAENLAELAEIARGEEDYWENEVAGWMGTGVHWTEPAWARPSGLVHIGPAMGVKTARANPQGLKPKSEGAADGTAEAMPFHEVRTHGSHEGGASDSHLACHEPSEALPDSHVSLDDSRLRTTLQGKIEGAPWLVMNASVDRLWFVGEPVAVQRRIVKAIGEQAGVPLEFKHVEEILRFAAEEEGSGKELSLPLGWKMVREAHELIFVTPDLREPVAPEEYEYELSVPGEVAVSEAGSWIEVRRISPGGEAYNPEHLLDADALPGRLKVRNWRAGDRFWPAHRKSPKKVKELLQERHVALPERKLWPVVVSGNEIVWMRGFPLPARYQAKPGHEGLLIWERTGIG